jgi:hypothetical protein
MTLIELKTLIIRDIESTNDSQTLEMLKIVLESRNSKTPELTDWQLKRIAESEKQYKEGKYISKEESDKKIIEWLKK